MTCKLYLDVLPKPQLQVWHFLRQHARVLRQWHFYLAGGTALALQLGHRQSVDFDFFSKEGGHTEALLAWLEQAPKSIVREVNQNTVHAEISGVKVSFIGGYRYSRVNALCIADGLDLADIVEIGLMKILAITHRATVRDYIDLAAILKNHVTLGRLMRQCKKKYGKRFNELLPLRALVSFEDLDMEMPKMFDTQLKKSWKMILRQAVKCYV